MINKKFNKIIELILKYINEGYVILLESDLVSLMFHSYLLLEENIPNKIHINSRISQSKSDREKIDFVIGEIINPKKLRPKIEPEIIVKVPRYILIFDGVNYFEDKIEMIIQERNTVDTGIELIRIYKTNSKYFA